MQKWQLGFEDPTLREIIGTRPQVSLEGPDFEKPSDLTILMPRTLGRARQVAQPGSRVLVLVPPGGDLDLPTDLPANWTLFHLGRTPEAHENLRTFLDLTAREIEAARRLDRYITDSFREVVDSTILKQQKEEIRRMNDQFRRLAQIDFLTNLLNRRAILEAFEKEKRRALRNLGRLNSVPEKRNKGPVDDHIGRFSCQMVDIDHFKEVNDRHGHLAGDAVLKKFSEIVQEKGLFRDTDVIGRFGGEEFVILLPETSLENAAIPAERLRKKVEESEFRDHEGRKFSVTVSIGVAQFDPGETSCDELIHRADLALYHAKENGRNKVVLYRGQESLVG